MTSDLCAVEDSDQESCNKVEAVVMEDHSIKSLFNLTNWRFL